MKAWAVTALSILCGSALPASAAQLDAPSGVQTLSLPVSAMTVAVPATALPAALPPQLPEQALPSAAVAPVSAPLAAASAALAASASSPGNAGNEAAREISSSLFDKAAAPDAQVVPEAEGAQEISREIEEPPQVLRRHGIHATVAVYGSARIPSPEKARAQLKDAVERYGRRPKSAAGKKALRQAKQDGANSRYYALARRFGELVARGGKGRVAVVTGGGPGIMEAANRGAFEAGGPSIGLNIKLLREQSANPYITPGLSIDFQDFSPRKRNLRHGAVAMAFFPGGFGTMDELFEVLTLMQTGKIRKVPIVLMGEKSYWDKILDFEAFSRMGLIAPNDLKLFHFAETAETAWKIVSGHAPRAK